MCVSTRVPTESSVRCGAVSVPALWRPCTSVLCATAVRSQFSPTSQSQLKIEQATARDYPLCTLQLPAMPLGYVEQLC